MGSGPWTLGLGSRRLIFTKNDFVFVGLFCKENTCQLALSEADGEKANQSHLV